ncbi:MAG: hypothetical protein DWQ34_05130 [Planctomycetota bacterium]|nr:MAG: hypothetical protein DWQ34_05130 [Planctomycetota bacterium]
MVRRDRSHLSRQVRRTLEAKRLSECLLWIIIDRQSSPHRTESFRRNDRVSRKFLPALPRVGAYPKTMPGAGGLMRIPADTPPANRLTPLRITRC